MLLSSCQTIWRGTVHCVFEPREFVYVGKQQHTCKLIRRKAPDPVQVGFALLCKGSCTGCLTNIPTRSVVLECVSSLLRIGNVLRRSLWAAVSGTAFPFRDGVPPSLYGTHGLPSDAEMFSGSSCRPTFDVGYPTSGAYGRISRIECYQKDTSAGRIDLRAVCDH